MCAYSLQTIISLENLSHDNIMITLSEANLLAASTFSLRFAVSCENFCCSPTRRESCCSLALCSGCERWTSNSWWLRLSMLALAVSNSAWSCDVKKKMWKKWKRFTVLLNCHKIWMFFFCIIFPFFPSNWDNANSCTLQKLNTTSYSQKLYFGTFYFNSYYFNSYFAFIWFIINPI